MKKIKPCFLLLFLLMSIISMSNSQVQSVFDPNNPKWNQLPSSVLYPSGEYQSLPQKIESSLQPTAPRVIKTPYEVLVANPNVQVVPSPGSTQTEVPIAICRTNQNLMFGSSNAVTGSTINSGSYISTDGGNTWSGYNYINNGNTSNQRGDPGPTIDKNQTIIFTHLSSNSNFGGVTGMAAEYSTNAGQNFSASVQVESNGNVDKNLAGTDDNPGSPYYGNSYFAWTVLIGVTGNGHFARTTNGGVSWSSPIILNSTPSGYFAQGHDVAVRPNGDVIVCWTTEQASSPYTSRYIGVAKSTDGGQTFTPTEQAYQTYGTRSFSFNGWGVRTNDYPRIAVDKSGGSRNGWIYIVEDEYNLAPAGSDADVIMHRSTDGGTTWSAGIRVNQDALNNGAVQFFPCICVDNNGGVNVIYYDNRNFPAYGDSCSVFMSRSLDGGNTWTDIEVADHHFKPKSCYQLGGYMGDYIGCGYGNGKVWAFWMDDKPYYAGFYQAWAGYVSTITGVANNNNEVPASYSLKQNYPNPFNPSTQIEYALPKAGLTKLVVYDVKGANVTTLVNGYEEAGTHNITFKADNITSGVYFYKINSGDFTSVKKMILVK